MPWAHLGRFPGSEQWSCRHLTVSQILPGRGVRITGEDLAQMAEPYKVSESGSCYEIPTPRGGISYARSLIVDELRENFERMKADRKAQAQSVDCPVQQDSGDALTAVRQERSEGA